LNDDRLPETERAYRAVVGLLNSPVLSPETILQLRKLKRLLEIELAARALSKKSPGDIAAD
jgi:hypothetical protein